ncbi:hypothetical protein ACLM5H_17305 [Fredinandcohnia humi]
MEYIKRSGLPFILFLVIAVILLNFGNREISYEEITFENIPEEMKNGVLLDFGPGFSGLYEFGNTTYAYLGTEPDEKAIIEFVGDAHDGVGKEVRYSIEKQDSSDHLKVIPGRFGDYSLTMIRLEKKVSGPFGFFKVEN